MLLQPARLLPICALALLLAFAGTQTARAGQEIHVNTTQDITDGNCVVTACSLRDAIGIANSTPEQDTIVLGAGTYEINIPVAAFDPLDFSSASGDLDITQPVVIEGEGRDLTTIEFQGEYRGFHIQQLVPLELHDLTVLNVNAADATGGINTIFEVIAEGVKFKDNHGGQGGAIAAPGNQAVLTMTDVIFEGNTSANFGGAIYGGAGGTFRNVQFLNNSNDFPSLHGGALSIGGDVLIEDSVFDGNSTGGSGAAIYAPSYSLTIINTTFSNNHAAENGGAIYNPGAEMNITDSEITDNTAGLQGGGIYNTGPLAITGSTISGNQAGAITFGAGIQPFSGTGGGIHSEGGLTVTNSTISGNVAVVDGGGIHSLSGADILNTTITANTSPVGAGVAAAGPVNVTNTIIADNNGDDCGVSASLSTAAVVAQGATGFIGNHSMDSDDTCGFTVPGNISNGDAKLGPLALNGGPTHTHTLLDGSDAIDSGDNGACPATDQRGFTRPQGNACDMGAVESGSTAPTPTPPPGSHKWGDNRCDGNVDATDALSDLRITAGLSQLAQTEPCPDVGTNVNVAGASIHPWGDANCSGAVNAVDALSILKSVAGLTPLAQTEPCPDVGSQVILD